jgi:hypothetical protein
MAYPPNLSYPNIMRYLQVTEWCHHGSLYDLLHTSDYFIRDSSIGRLSLVSNKRHSSARPSNYSFRMSNTSSVDNDEDGAEGRLSHVSAQSASINLKDAVALMEEGTHTSTNAARTLSGDSSGRSGVSNRRSMKSGNYTAVTTSQKSTMYSSMRVVVDPKNDTVTEVSSEVVNEGQSVAVN